MVDVETTGFGRQDRIVEIAIVCLDADGLVVDEFSTLINPQRDVGAVEVHGMNDEPVVGGQLLEAETGVDVVDSLGHVDVDADPEVGS